MPNSYGADVAAGIIFMKMIFFQSGKVQTPLVLLIIVLEYRLLLKFGKERMRMDSVRSIITTQLYNENLPR